MSHPSTAWSAEALERIAATEEIGIASRRPDGSLRPSVTIWAVVANGGVYVRSAHGVGNGWFRRAVRSGEGSIRVGRDEFAVDVLPAGPEEQDAVDDAYRAEYARYPGIVPSIVGPAVHAVTLRLDPATRPTTRATTEDPER